MEHFVCVVSVGIRRRNIAAVQKRLGVGTNVISGQVPDILPVAQTICTALCCLPEGTAGCGVKSAMCLHAVPAAPKNAEL